MTRTVMVPRSAIASSLWVLVGFSSVSWAGPSISHYPVDDLSGRILLDFGESAQFSSDSTRQGFRIQIDPSTIGDSQAALVDHAKMDSCKLTYSPNPPQVNFNCESRGLDRMNSYLVSDPRRFVLEYTLKQSSVSGSRSPSNVSKVSNVSKSQTDKGSKLASETVELKKVTSTELSVETSIDPTSVEIEKQKKAPEKQKRTWGRDLTLIEKIKLRNRVHLKFDTLRMPVSFHYDLPVLTPKEESHSIANLYNLALKLFRESRYGLVLRTLDFIRKSDAAHPYWRELSFLEAETYVKLADAVNGPRYFQEAVSRYRAAFGRYPDSPFVEPGISHVGRILLERQENYGAIDLFIYGLHTFPESSMRNEWKMGIAEAMFRQNRFSEAATVYRELAGLPSGDPLKVSGRFRAGDTHSAQRHYDKAIEAYIGAVELEMGEPVSWDQQSLASGIELPSTIQDYPNVLFNLGEAYFWTGRLSESLWCFRKFTDLYPLHGNRGMAWSRIGELLAIFKAPEAEVSGAYLESRFRHPESTGADLATLRIASRDLVEGDEFQQRRAKLEFDHLQKKYEKHEEMTDFIVLLRGQVEQEKRRYMAGFQLLDAELMSRPKRPYRDQFTRKIYELISQGFRETRRSGRCPELFHVYEEKKNTWFNFENPFFDQYLEAAICALKMNAPGLAFEFMKKYQSVIEEAKRDQNRWMENTLVQTVVTPTEIDFYEGVALLQQERTDQSISEFKTILDRGDARPYVKDSARMYLVLAYLKKKEPNRAYEYLNQITDRSIFSLYPYDILEEVTKLKRFQEFETALTVLDDLLRTMVSPAKQLPIWMAKAEVLWLQRKRAEATQIYQRIVNLKQDEYLFTQNQEAPERIPLSDTFEDDVDRIRDLQIGLRSIMEQPNVTQENQALSAYRVGLQSRELGDLETSIDYFKKSLEFAPQSVWAKAASSELNSMKFEDKYQNTINTHLEKNNKKARRVK